MPGGNVAEADPRRLAAIVKLFIGFKIAGAFRVGIDRLVFVDIAELIRRFSGKLTFRGERLLTAAASLAAASATAAARASFAAIGLWRRFFGRFGGLKIQSFAKIIVGSIRLVRFGRRLFAALGGPAIPPSPATTAAASATLLALLRSHLAGSYVGMIAGTPFELVGCLVHEVQCLLRFERLRLHGGRIDFIPSRKLRLNLRGKLGGRHAFFNVR